MSLMVFELYVIKKEGQKIDIFMYVYLFQLRVGIRTLGEF